MVSKARGSGVKQYLDLMRYVLDNGTKKEDRTGTGTLSVFGRQMRFNLEEGFPLLTTKRVHHKAIIHELIWFIRGDTNIKYLVENDIKIWNEWPFQKYLQTNNLEQEYPKYSDAWQKKLLEFIDQIKKDPIFAQKWGDLGPVYGKQWRNFNGIDQLKNIIERIKTKPHDRRLMITAWNPAEVDNMTLPPCHCLFQFYVNNGKLSCQLYQRSCDIFLGVPFNIASYALLTIMVAQATNLKPGDFIWTGGDVHLYLNHLNQVKEQLGREPKPLPIIKLNPKVKSLFDFKYEDFELDNYNPHPAIKAPVSV